MAKKLISIRLDDDILDWFRAKSPDGYQTKINKVLREYRDRNQLRNAALIGRAQQIFLQYYARCFWHLRGDLTITAELVPLVQDGLRKHGGREGMLLAREIDLT